MENLEILEQMAANQKIQAHTIMNLTMVLDNVCRRIVDLEQCVERMSGYIASQEILGNTVLPKNKTKGRVIPLSIVAREIASEK